MKRQTFLLATMMTLATSCTKSNAKREETILNDIKLRTTLRIPFDTIPMKEADWMTLVAVDPSNIHYFSAASEKGNYIKQKELESYTQQANNKNAQDELASWIRKNCLLRKAIYKLK